MKLDSDPDYSDWSDEQLQDHAQGCREASCKYHGAYNRELIDRRRARTQIRAPWSETIVEKLNAYQRGRQMHPFTCGNRSAPGHEDHGDGDVGVLVATPDGWICRDCDYTQDWAHRFMAGLS